MDTLTIEGTLTKPHVKFDTKNGLLEISGRSIEENATEFYLPLIEYIQKYGNAPAENTTINIRLEYINTASTRCLLEVLKNLEAISLKGNKMLINWYYEEGDDDMLETGEDILNMMSIPFKIYKAS